MTNKYDDVYWKIAEIMESCKRIIGRIDASLVAVAGSFWVMNILSRERISFAARAPELAEEFQVSENFMRKRLEFKAKM